LRRRHRRGSWRWHREYMTARGYGYGGYFGPRDQPGYYGPEGADVAGAFARQAGRERQAKLDKLAADEANLRMEGERYQLRRHGEVDPLEDAIRRAAAREHGILGPAETGAQSGSGVQSLPPAGVMGPGGGTRGTRLDPGF